ncbi:MAG: pyridoxal phosphate-dependent aminotransferase [Eubacteriales bacterium]
MVSEEMLALGTARSVIRELFEYGKERGKVIGEENVFDFSLGNPNCPPPPEIQAKARELLSVPNIHGYTSAQGDVGARTRLAQALSQKSGRTYLPEHFYLTVGAAAALTCCIRGLCCPQDEFLVLAPYFPEYLVFIQGNGGKAVIVPPDIPSFQVNFTAFSEKITPNTKAVLINTPNNPTGVVYDPQTLKKMGEILREKSAEYGHPIYLISDEPYRELVYQEEKIPWVADFYENTIVCYSFSKSLSLAGERLGYFLVGDHVADWETVYWAMAGAGRSMGFVNAPSLFQQVCSYTSHLTGDLDFYRNNRDILYQGLNSFGYEIQKPQGAFYLFPKALEEDDVAFCMKARDFDLLLVPGSGFGAQGYFRISYCVSATKVEGSLVKFQELAQFYGKG